MCCIKRSLNRNIVKNNLVNKNRSLNILPACLPVRSASYNSRLHNQFNYLSQKTFFAISIIEVDTSM